MEGQKVRYQWKFVSKVSKKGRNFVCQSCGMVYSRWSGHCDSCGEWNSIIEEEVNFTSVPKLTGGKGGQALKFQDLSGQEEISYRYKSGIKELDRVCGGGLVSGSVLLVGGDPGIGKSTLLLQVTAALSKTVNVRGEAIKSVYISGEEAVSQVQLRAKRLGLSDYEVKLASSSNIRDIVATLDDFHSADIVVIDSIQTMFIDTIDSSPGSVGQVRACANELIRLAKKRGFVLFLVGHVTKEGTLAGPRVLEHMVDTVLYFEGERGHQFRILRTVKNRFGATDEIGVFEMTDKGLSEVSNPSALFLAERRGNVSGSCVFAGIEGSRPILVEIQALVSSSGLGMPRRAVVGWDTGRLSMILAVLEARLGIRFSDKDVYLNVAGGMRITEPAGDLAVSAALLSSLGGVPVSSDMVVFGEVGLSGEIRAVSQIDLRLKEAMKMGFNSAIIPRNHKQKQGYTGIKAIEYGNLQSLVDFFGLGERRC